MAGVPKRHPELRLSFLEGGVTWAAQLYADLLGHYDKRNKDAVQRFDPARFDVEQAGELFAEFADGPLRDYGHRVEEGAKPLGDPRRRALRHRRLRRVGDHRSRGHRGHLHAPARLRMRSRRPDERSGVQQHMLPHGARLNAMFASDIGHWDVPDLRGVLPEAWELVEDGHLTSRTSPSSPAATSCECSPT